MELEMREEVKKRGRIVKWLKKRSSLRANLDTFEWRVGFGAMLLLNLLAFCLTVPGMPTGLGTAVDLLLFGMINLFAVTALSELATIVLSMLYAPLPRRYTAITIITGIEVYVILVIAEFSVKLAILLSLSYIVFGLVSGLVLSGLLYLFKHSRRLAAAGALAAVAAGSIVLYVIQPVPAAELVREVTMEGEPVVEAEDLLNPAKRGPYTVRELSYGSGKDKHRGLFGSEVDLAANSVDASDYISKWPTLRKWFWGFDQRELPINGRVWMPEGEGPFPLVLMVHGNHLMEDFSDGGYGYLGELFASKGMIAVSVDENFFNYSVWSGIPEHDQKLRAWLLLKHVQQLQAFHEEPDNVFSGKVDFARTALIGHSRGGQAVAMAADYEQWFDEDRTLDSLQDVQFVSVASLAPTDRVVDDKLAQLHNVNYLTLQGSRDADINLFYGDRQYSRTTFDEESGKFKAALYITDANHSQFNTSWGMLDEPLPGGLFLNLRDLMDGEDQRTAAKVYLSAFLEATLQGKTEYKDLFRDYRTGSEWLPETIYIHRFEESSYVELIAFDEAEAAASVEVDGMTDWEITDAEDRDGNEKDSTGIMLEWDEAGASYVLKLNEKVKEELTHLDSPALVFSMANYERDKSEEEKEEELKQLPLPELEVELTLLDERSTTIDVDEVMPIAPPAYTSYMAWDWLEESVKNKKYAQSTEPIFQTFVIPISYFGSDVTLLETDVLTFRFSSMIGKVMLADIGFIDLTEN